MLFQMEDLARWLAHLVHYAEVANTQYKWIISPPHNRASQQWNKAVHWGWGHRFPYDPYSYNLVCCGTESSCYFCMLKSYSIKNTSKVYYYFLMDLPVHKAKSVSIPDHKWLLDPWHLSGVSLFHGMDHLEDPPWTISHSQPFKWLL